MLYPQLPELFDTIRTYWEQIGQLEIITNGTVIPSDRLLEQLGQWPGQIRFLIDDYGENLSWKVAQITAALDGADIPFIVRNNTETNPHCGGWVDHGDPKDKRRKTQEDLEAVFAKCAYPQKLGCCFSIKDGYMYPCPQVRLCKELGTADSDADYIDLFDDLLSINEQREKIRAIYAAKSFAACAYCNGTCDDSERFIPAEQLTEEEVRAIRAKN